MAARVGCVNGNPECNLWAGDEKKACILIKVVGNIALQSHIA